ncbi:MAG: YncE family protein [Prevotella ruminicola]|uniref:YncE family protein n=1 Tax=Xylanibacter ruminicola TaxID=839 RepID=A0A9D5S6G9_XYLRU|nr:YncE family protein [Xylanibacter ruminicola]
MKHIVYLLAILLLSACRQDVMIVPMENIDTGGKAQKGEIFGMYLLNEGNMGSNKSSLDYLDLSGDDETTHYYRNIYQERNPNTVMALGDVGNDCQIYGSRLWLVINCSNKVEVARAADAVRIGKVDIPNCRYVTFKDQYAYVSSYVGAVYSGSSSPLGSVFKVDTLTLQKVDSCSVGYQPEEMAIIGNHLYVANSGGYQGMTGQGYESTMSVIDLATMQEVDKIEVAPNLHHLKADKYNQLWVTARGNYMDEKSSIYWLEPTTNGQMKLGGHIDQSVSDLCIVGDSLYFYGSQWSEVSMTNTVTYGIINVKTHQVVSSSLSDAPEISKIRMPYGIIVNPIHRDFYLMDAKNYVSSGELLHFLPDGTFDWKVKTGDIPAHAAFLFKSE